MLNGFLHFADNKFNNDTDLMIKFNTWSAYHRLLPSYLDHYLP